MTQKTKTQTKKKTKQPKHTLSKAERVQCNELADCIYAAIQEAGPRVGPIAFMAVMECIGLNVMKYTTGEVRFKVEVGPENQELN